MTPGARLAAIIELLQQIYEVPKPADATASAYFRGRRFMGAKDRAFVAEKVYDTLRRHARLEWWIERSGATATPRTRALANAILADHQGAETIDGLFSGKFGPVPLSIYEQAMIRKLDNHTLDHPEMPEAVRAECPEWAEPHLRDTFAETFLRECQALIPPAQIDLRVNTLKTTREAALAGLQASGIECWAGKYAPTAIRVKGRPAIMAHPLYKSGAIEIQDEGSQLVAYMLNPLPGQAVMDFCAGAGGKTLALGALMQNKGRVVAADVLTSRLARAKDRFRRAGLQNVETRPLDEEAGKWLKRRAASFDRVLVDAPCSGVGTWRRNPDMRWRPLGPKLEELTALQTDILARAAPLVKPGGRLAYATCSLLRAENEAIIEAFLTTHADFTLLPMDKIRAEVLPEMKGISGEYLRLTPSRHGTDGFFTAVLEKKIHVIPGDPATP